MDDFLHNLRSGKLKQQDRGRSYNDPQYKSGQRRGAMDRRKKELETFERLNAIKEVLETIAETQKSMAEAYAERTQAENRKARAMEVLAKNLYQMLNPKAKDVDALFATEPATEKAIQSTKAIESPSDNTEKDATSAPKKLTNEQRQSLFNLIGEMRDSGSKWEQIARHIASKGYPTISGKGIWRGVMAKNLYEKMVAS
jgi:chemotaxis protein histidine kinase CheA